MHMISKSINGEQSLFLPSIREANTINNQTPWIPPNRNNSCEEDTRSVNSLFLYDRLNCTGCSDIFKKATTILASQTNEDSVVLELPRGTLQRAEECFMNGIETSKKKDVKVTRNIDDDSELSGGGWANCYMLGKVHEKMGSATSLYLQLYSDAITAEAGNEDPVELL
eukprot:UC4_evm1s555